MRRIWRALRRKWSCELDTKRLGLARRASDQAGSTLLLATVDAK